ncbi:VTT domain-containing protein [Candidatus Campbellbacteria bacterium]|nr:MAG: VTT domain-containing protein [Candidatus Campbellbacteria bacterium]
MLGDLILFAQSLFLSIGPWGVFVLGFLQEVIPPIPSTLVTVSAGFFFLEGAPFSWAAFLRLFLYIGLPIAVGLSLGSLIIYGIVYWGGKPIVLKYGVYMGISWDEVEKMRVYMEGHTWDDVLLFAARSFPLMPSIAINVFCGLVRWRPVPFFLHTFFGTIIRSMWSGFIGWQFGNFYLKYSTMVEGAQNSILVIGVLVCGAFLYYHKKKKNMTRNVAPSEEVVE